MLATHVFAVRVVWSAPIANLQIGKGNQKLDSVDEDKAEQMLEHMSTWSGGKYTARKAAKVPNMIIVSSGVECA